jgi:hypothetical protein
MRWYLGHTQRDVNLLVRLFVDDLQLPSRRPARQRIFFSQHVTSESANDADAETGTEDKS